jgi:DNA repair protein SbcC/Rad50
MRLISLRLRQWRCYEDCAIDFPDGLIGVRGPNGAGKSTVAEAIGWALFGKRRLRAKVADLRRQGAPKGAKSCVELEFQLGSSNYRIERFVGGDARLWINGELETQKATDTNARVAQELDLTWEVFQRTVFAQQKDVAALDPSASSDQRKSHVERLLGLERFKNAATRARSDAKILSAELTGLRELAPDPQEIRRLLEAAEGAAAEGDPAVVEAQEACDQATKTRDAARKSLSEEQERGKAHGLLMQRKETAEKAREEGETALDRLKPQITEKTKQIKRLEKLAPEVATLKTVEKTLDLWDGLASARRELQTVESQLMKLPYDRKYATAEQKRLTRLIDERTGLLSERPERAAMIAVSASRLSALHAVKKAGTVADAKAATKQLESDLKGVHDKITVAKSELAHDRIHVGEVETGGPETPCPTCRKPYGDEYGEILEGYRTRMAGKEAGLPGLEALSERLQSKLDAALDKLNTARQAADVLDKDGGSGDLTTATDELTGHEQELRGLDERLKTLKLEIPKLSKACEERDGLGERWQELEAERKTGATRVANASKALGITDYDEAAHARLRKTYEQLIELDQEAADLRETTADVPHLTEQLGENIEKEKAAQEDLRQIEDELGKLRFDNKRLAELSKAATNADAARDQAQEALTKTKLEAQSRSQEVIRLRKALRDAKKSQDAIDSKTDDVRRHEVAASLLAKYRDQQARRAWPRLEQVASALLNAATDGRYADLKLSEDYRLIIVDRGEEHELGRFSGGEQDLANLCLRLAIADWVSKERNVDLGFVILDEVFGSQDEERRQRLLSELRGLSNRFRQMFLVTHLPELAELCDEQILVTIDEPGRSTVSLV